MELPNATTVAAIALWGRHPILLVGGETNDPAETLARTMAEALPDLRHHQRKETEAIWRRAGIGRTSSGKAHRPPHVGARPGDPILAGENERVGLGELAHNGVLAGKDIQAWEERHTAELLIAAARGTARRRNQDRELLCDCRVTGSTTGCGCRNRAQRCECRPAEIEAARRELWAVSAYHLFDIAVPGPRAGDEIDAAKLRNTWRQARLFALTTRDQRQANARTKPANGGAGWTLTRAARARLEQLDAAAPDRERILQVARSAADVDGSRRIDEAHIATAELLTTEQRRYGPHGRRPEEATR